MANARRNLAGLQASSRRCRLEPDAKVSRLRRDALRHDWGRLVDALVVRARALDAEFAAGALAAATSPPRPRGQNTIVSQTVLTRIVDAVESARSAATVRSMLETAIDEFAETARVSVNSIKGLVTTPEST